MAIRKLTNLLGVVVGKDLSCIV